MRSGNLLDGNTSSFTSTLLQNVGNWVGVTNCTLSRTTKRFHTGIASALIAHDGVGTTMSAESGEAEMMTLAPVSAQHAHGGDHVFRAILWFHHEVPNREVRVGIQFYDITLDPINYTSAHYRDVPMGFGEWTLAVVDVVVPVDAEFGSVRVDLVGIDTSSDLDGLVWIDDVALLERVEISEETFVGRISRWIPAYMLEDDAAQSNPVNPLLSFLDVAGVELSEIQELIPAFGYERVGNPLYPTATSSLIDPSDFPEGGTKAEWLSWIAQLVGLRPGAITENLDGGAWDILDSDYPTWADWEDTLNGDPLPAAVAATSASRTSGTVEVIKANHGLVAGDVVSVTGASPTTFRGFYEVETASTNAFYYSQSYVIQSLIRVGTTVTIVCGRPHGLSIGSSVIVAGTGVTAANGTFSVTGVSESDSGKSGIDTLTYTTVSSGALLSYTGTVYPANGSATGLNYQVASDLSWRDAEGVSFYSLTRAQSLAEFIRTGASGVWAGTEEGLKRAARIPLSGFDERCSVERNDGTLTMTLETTVSAEVGDWIEVYGSAESSVNRNYLIDSISTDHGVSIITASSGGSYVDPTLGFVTNRRVEVERSAWVGVISQISVTSNICTVSVSNRVPLLNPSGDVTITGTGNVILDATHSPVSITLAPERDSFTFPLTTSNITLFIPTAGRVKLEADRNCFVISTLAAQTSRSDVVSEYAQFAKPAGSVVTHEFYTGP